MVKSRSRQRWPAAARAVLLVGSLAAVLVLALGMAWPAVVRAQTPDGVGVARAFNAARNAHDLAAALALFAPDATVKQPASSISFYLDDQGLEATDVHGTRVFLADAGLAPDATGNVVWAAGSAELQAWVEQLLAHVTQVDAMHYQAVGDLVAWEYQEVLDPCDLDGRACRAVPSVTLPGTAEAVIQAGKITRLTLTPYRPRAATEMSAQQSAGAAVADAYVAAMNRHDSGAALALFATDAVADDDGRRSQGTEELRRWLQEQVNRDVLIQFRARPTASGGAISWVALFSFDDGGPVRTELWLSATMGMQAGKITSFTTHDAVLEGSVPNASAAFHPSLPTPAQVPPQNAPAPPRKTLAVTVPYDVSGLAAPLLVGGLGAAAYLVLLTRRPGRERR